MMRRQAYSISADNSNHSLLNTRFPSLVFTHIEIAFDFYLIDFLLKMRVINMALVCSIRAFLLFGQRARHKWVSLDEEIKDDSGYADGTGSPQVARGGCVPEESGLRCWPVSDLCGYRRWMLSGRAAPFWPR
jgi:hypothetical protein